jgi:hypothetical protein
MRGWLLFWTISLILAGASFAGITGIVTILGFRDLREMLIRLRRRSDE